MSDLERLTRDAVRQFSGGEAPIRDTPDERGGWTDPYLGSTAWRRAAEEQAAAGQTPEADADEEPTERLSDGSEIGDTAGDAVASWAAAGWGRQPMVTATELEAADEPMASPGDFAAAAYANADQIREDYNMSPREYLEAWRNAKPMTAHDLVERAYATADAEGMDPDGWLAWAATCSREEWEAACAESGWDPAARPGFVDIPTSARNAAIQRDIDQAVADARAGIRRPL